METVHYEHNIASKIKNVLFLRFVVYKVQNVRVLTPKVYIITRVNLMKVFLQLAIHSHRFFPSTIRLVSGFLNHSLEGGGTGLVYFTSLFLFTFKSVLFTLFFIKV